MSGIVTSGTSCTDVGLSSEDIDKFAFTLVAPLGTKSGGMLAKLEMRDKWVLGLRGVT
jgi:hypothetical protein